MKKIFTSKRKNSSLLYTSVFVSLLVILSKLFGFGREALIAAYYGATAETDAFFLAQSMPGMIFPAVCNSISTTFVSLYVTRLVTEREEDADRYASRMVAAAMLLGVLLSLLGVLLSPVLVPLFAPGFSGSQQALAVHLTRLTMGAFILVMLQYMLSAILNSKKLFIGSQVSGLAYNAMVIAVTLLLGQGQSMDILTLTVILGHLVQVAGLAACCRGHFHPALQVNPLHSDTWMLFRLSLPVLLGNSVVQLNTIVDKALSSLLQEGSLSALNYGNTLSQLVISVFIMSLSTVLYPTLTTSAASSDMEQYSKLLRQSLSGLTCMLVPVSCITLLTARDIVDTVYARGNFDQTAVAYTTMVLACYAPMFVGSGIRELLSRAFYALQNTQTPMVNSAIGVGCNILFSLLFVRWLGIAGIALGTTLSSFLTAGLLVRSLCQRMPALRLTGFFRSLGKQLLAGAILIAGLLVFQHLVVLPYAFLRFLVNAGIGFAVYFAVLLPLDGGTFRELFLRLPHQPH